VVTPILGNRDSLTAADLTTIAGKLAAFEAWRAEKPVTKVDALDEAWLDKLAAPDLRAALTKLIADDKALGPEYDHLSEVAKVVRFRRDLGRVLRNFVNFSDFYSKKDAAFQLGRLYFDARELKLTMHVSDAARHAALDPSSDAYLIYLDATREGKSMPILAAVTNGDAENIFVGRNGLFYDRKDNAWDATVTKIVSNPISIREAFWAPYKKVIKVIEDQVSKSAAKADAEANAKLEDGAKSTVAEVNAEATKDEDATVAAAAAAPPPAPAAAPPPAEKKFDLSSVALIGVAIGGIGTLFGTVFGALFGLGMWMPVGLLALLLMISGPSMLLAWLKLRRRNLGPILDANGWAVNGRAKINVSFGAAMTEMPKLPEGSKRSFDDPFADKKTPWKRWVFLVVILGLGGLWYLGKLDGYLPDSISSMNVLGENAPAWKREHPPAPKVEEKKPDAKK
jgi:hypothetical protein